MKSNLTLDKEYSISDMLNKFKPPNGCISMMIKISKGKVTNEVYGEQKKNRINPLVSFFKDIAKKYPQINTTCLFHLNDWGTLAPFKDYPIFVFSKMLYPNKNIVIPDHLFLRNYNRWSRSNSVPYNTLIKQYKDSIPFEEREPVAFMRSGTSKNKVLNHMFSKEPRTDVKYTKNGFLTYEQIYKHRYSIIHYMRWDTVYMIFKSNFVPFLYTGFNNYLWYDIFLEDGIDYLSFQNLNQFREKRDEIDDDIDKQKAIANSCSEKADKYFTYDYAVEYMAEILLEYQKFIID